MAGKNSVFVDNSPPSVDATWLNLNQNEQNNLITGTGQTLSDAINNQQAISASRFAGNNFYIDSGTANAYILTLAASMTNPVSATVGYYVGMTIRFRAANANTGASTVNVNSAGVKSVKQTDGTTDPTAGMISPNVDTVARYNGTVFIIQGTASQYNVGTSSGQVPLIGTQSATTSLAGLSFLPKVITIANNSGTPNTIIDFGAGVAQADDGSLVFTVSATSKILQNSGAWAAGNNQNGLDTGARANSTYYYCFAIYNPTTLASDFLFSASKASPTLPSGYTKKCYLGALVTNGSGNIRNGTYKFIANGIYEFYLNVEITERSVATTTNSVTVTSPSGTFARCRTDCVMIGGGSNNNSEGWASDIFFNFAGAGQVANTGTTRGSSTYLYNNGSIAIGVGGQTGCTVNLYSNGWKETAN